MKNIQLFRPYFRVEECLEEIKVCLEKGWTGLGFKTVEFEEKWKSFSGLPYAHFLNSATAGLHLAVKILKDVNQWSEESEIITTPFTFVSTNHAIMYEHLRPVFADIDESLNMDLNSLLKRINQYTKAIIFVGIGGNPVNLLEVIKIAKQHNIKIILDASHMAGTTINGKHVGFDVDVSVFSFQAVKNLPTGDSGMICFADDTLDQLARKLAWLGIDKDTYARANAGSYKWKYDVDYVGYKYHGNSIMASLGLVGLRYLDEDNAFRRKLSALYQEQLESCPKIKLVKHSVGESSRHLFQVLINDREKVISELNREGVFPGVHYRNNIEYKPYQYAKGMCPNCERFSEMVLSLPLFVGLSDEDVEYVCQVLVKTVC